MFRYQNTFYVNKSELEDRCEDRVTYILENYTIVFKESEVVKLIKDRIEEFEEVKFGKKSNRSRVSCMSFVPLEFINAKLLIYEHFIKIPQEAQCQKKVTSEETWFRNAEKKKGLSSDLQEKGSTFEEGDRETIN